MERAIFVAIDRIYAMHAMRLKKQSKYHTSNIGIDEVRINSFHS